MDVHGVDLASNMIAIAQDYRVEMEAEVKHRVQFYLEDATLMTYPKNFYDVVYRWGKINSISYDSLQPRHNSTYSRQGGTFPKVPLHLEAWGQVDDQRLLPWGQGKPPKLPFYHEEYSMS